MTDNNSATIKRVANGYLLTTEAVSEVNPDHMDGEYIFPSLTELIQFMVIMYEDCEE
jgi:hypothetical protein